MTIAQFGRTRTRVRFGDCCIDFPQTRTSDEGLMISDLNRNLVSKYGYKIDNMLRGCVEDYHQDNILKVS